MHENSDRQLLFGFRRRAMLSTSKTRATAAYEVIRKHYIKLVEVIVPSDVAGSLYAQTVVNRDVLDRTLRESPGTRSDKAHSLMREVERVIKADAKNFDLFCEILSEEPTTSLSNELRKEFEAKVGHVKSDEEKFAGGFESQLVHALRVQLKVIQETKTTNSTEEDAKRTVVHSVLKEFLRNCGYLRIPICDIKKQIQQLYDRELIIDEEIYQWASSEIDKLDSDVPISSLQDPGVATSAVPIEKRFLFNHKTVNHAMLCCLAVNSPHINSLEFYNKHTLKEVSVSNDGKILIAKEGLKYFVAFKNEPNVSEWSKLNSIAKGVSDQCSKIPIRFFVDQILDGVKIVLSGFSFGGLIACSLAAELVKIAFVRPETLRSRLMVITFGQPLIEMPLVKEIMKKHPCFREMVHCVFAEVDVLPQILSYLQEECRLKSSPSTSAITKTSFCQVQVMILGHLMVLQDSTNSLTKCNDAVMNINKLLKVFSPEESTLIPLSFTPYLISADEVWKNSASSNAYFTTHHCVAAHLQMFEQHCMKSYVQSINSSYLSKDGHILPNCQHLQLKTVKELVPEMKEVAFHQHGDEVAVILRGNNLWFTTEVEIVPLHFKCAMSPQENTKKLLQFNNPCAAENKPVPTFQFQGTVVNVSLHSGFSEPLLNKPVDVTDKEEYNFTVRQTQLAKHSPSELIELAYLCALLEKHSYGCLNSSRFGKIRDFLKEAIEVVPIESLMYTIAYAKDDTVMQKCGNALLNNTIQIPPSVTLVSSACHALSRLDLKYQSCSVDFHMLFRAFECLLQNPSVLRSVPDTQLVRPRCVSVSKPDTSSQFNFRTFSLSSRRPIRTRNKSESCYSEDTESMYSEDAMAKENFAFIYDYLTKASKTKGNPLISMLSKMILKAFNSPETAKPISGLNIEQIYADDAQQNKLKSPIDTLKEGHIALAKFSELSSHEMTGCLSSLKNSKMLEVVSTTRKEEICVCTSLLGTFMEEQVRIPLIHPIPTEASITAAVSTSTALGMWVLIGFGLHDFQSLLPEHKSLNVEVTRYMRGIFEGACSDSDAENYAGKLQFILHGLKKTVSCNTHFISYSLERQLVEFCEKQLGINGSTGLQHIIDKCFQEGILSLVAKSHRALVARWLKWALMVHKLREELARYMAVGVVGLVNSGKSLLVNELFHLQVPTGTSATARTTVPFMYNLNSKVDGLDVIDFPGVDDCDDTIPELANILLALAQVVIFVVDYRKAHTASSKSWLEQLRRQRLPVLVCLTFADKLYSEKLEVSDHQHCSMEDALKQELELIRDKLALPPSIAMSFFSLCRDKDSRLDSPEESGKLREAGIKSTHDVKEWLVSVFRNEFMHEDMAAKLCDYFRV